MNKHFAKLAILLDKLATLSAPLPSDHPQRNCPDFRQERKHDYAVFLAAAMGEMAPLLGVKGYRIVGSCKRELMGFSGAALITKHFTIFFHDAAYGFHPIELYIAHNNGLTPNKREVEAHPYRFPVDAKPIAAATLYQGDGMKILARRATMLTIINMWLKVKASTHQLFSSFKISMLGA